MSQLNYQKKSNYGKNDGIFIEETPGKKNLNGKLNPTTNKKWFRYYQSDFKIKINSSCFEISVFANQPIYSSENKNSFELIPKDLSEILGYSKFKIKHIEYHNIRKEGSDIKTIEELIEKTISLKR